MPSLTPVTEGTETLTSLAEGAETLAALAEAAETLGAISELTNDVTPAVPATYPSLDTYPSAAATWPSEGTPEIPGVGLALSGASEGALILTPLSEA